MASSLPSPIDLSPSKERDDYVRLARLIICGGTTVLRALFDTYHPPADLAKNLNHWKTHLETYARLTEPQKQLLYPGSGDPVSKNFDLSLLYKLLRNICGLTEPACKWNGRPLNGDTSTQDDIVRLRNCRNEIYGHVLEDMAISWDEFNKHWEDISKALNRINNAIPNKINPRDLDEEMSKLKFGPLTQDEKYNILHEIQETLNDHTEALSRIEKQGDEMGKRMECLEDTVIQTAIQQSQAPKSDYLKMKNTTKMDNKTTTINNNTTNHFNFNIDSASLEKLLSGVGGNIIKSPPGFLPLDSPSRLEDKRTISCPSSWNSGLEEIDKYTRSNSLFDKSDEYNDLRTNQLRRDFEHTNLSYDTTRHPVLQDINKSFHQEQFESVYNYGDKNTQRDNFQFPRSQSFSTSYGDKNTQKDNFQSPRSQSFSTRNAQESCTPQKPLYSNSPASNRRSFEEYNRSGRRNPALRQGDLPFQELAPNDGRILHINIRIRGNRNQDCHLGELISQSLSYDQTHKRFKSYLLQSRQLRIEKVDYQDDVHCCISVSADDLESLMNIWRDCMTNDIREIIKETVLPYDFDGKLEVSIDGKEYEQCCKRLKPKVLGEMRSYHSQSFSANQTQEKVEFSPRSQSLEELSSFSKKAFDELFLLLCKHGGKLQYTEVMKQLSPNGRAEIEKAMIQTNMDERFRILPGNVIQARLNFCSKSERKCKQLNCPNLHLCRYHLLAGCTFPGKCKNSHDITDHHTNRIFRDANLSSLTEEERSNLLKNLAYRPRVPEICRYYNTPGNKSTCKHNDHCRYLHVCKHWVNGKCFFNKPNKCSRAHTFDNPVTRKILKESNLHELSEDQIKEKLMKQNI